MSSRAKKRYDLNKTAKKQRALPRYYTPLVLVILTALIISGSILFLYFNHSSHNHETGQFTEGEAYSGENFDKSLDLKVAVNAKYTSSALNTVQDLSTVDNVREQIVSFNVQVDNLTEYGLLMLPSQPQPPHGYPVIILCHGYLNPAEYETALGYIPDMKFYAQHGFAVVKPDFRGQGISIHQGEPEGAYYSMAYNTDVLSLVSALKQTDYIDNSRISLWGHSLGAYVALRAAVLSKDIKNLILLSGPVGSLKEMYLAYVPPSDENNPAALRVRQAVFQKYGTPAENAGFWANASPINFLSRLSAHVQIYVGGQDRIVPPKLSSDLNDTLTRAKIPHEYFAYPEGGHGLVGQRQDIWSHSLQLLQTNPPPASL